MCAALSSDYNNRELEAIDRLKNYVAWRLHRISNEDLCLYGDLPTAHLFDGERVYVKTPRLTSHGYNLDTLYSLGSGSRAFSMPAYRDDRVSVG